MLLRFNFNAHSSNEYKRRLFNGTFIGYCYCMEQGEAMTTIPEIGKRKGKKKTKRDKVVTKQNTSGH